MEMTHILTEACDACSGSGFNPVLGSSCMACEGNGEVVLSDKELTDEQKRLADKGLPIDFLDSCEWCNGSGDDGGGYGACPDCQNTGYKYGQGAEQHINAEMDKSFDMSMMMMDMLATEHGFGRPEMIPYDINDFVHKYLSNLFSDEYYDDHAKAKQYMMDEVPPGMFDVPVIKGFLMEDGSLELGFDEHVARGKGIIVHKLEFHASTQGRIHAKDVKKIKHLFSNFSQAEQAETGYYFVEFDVTAEELRQIPPSIEIHSTI